MFLFKQRRDNWNFIVLADDETAAWENLKRTTGNPVAFLKLHYQVYELSKLTEDTYSIVF